MDKYDDLYRRAMIGKVTEQDIASVVNDLEKMQQAPNPYDLISILCYTDLTEHKRHLVEYYLKGPDGFVAGKALWVLCSCWDLSEHYIQDLLGFIDGAPWDYDDECKIMALSCAAIHLRKHVAPELLRKIIELAENATESERARSSAYSNLDYAIEGRISEYPGNQGKSSDDLAARSNILKLATEQLSKAESNHNSPPYMT